MNVKLLTIWREMNYGAELQAYATVKALQMLGHNVEMIYILLSDQYKPNIFGRISKYISAFGPAHKKFELFWRRNIPVTRRYYSVDELQTNPPHADVYLVGSDQVWNPDITRQYAMLYFLNFGNGEVRRISYASSFGTSRWTADYLTEQVSELLCRFDKLSCREQSGVNILKHTFGLASTLVVDPTLLFKEYPELTGNLVQRSTLVYYPLYEDAPLFDYAVDLSSRLRLRLVDNKWSKKIMGVFTWDRVSVEEWVKNIAEAKFVLTRSFHGLVFSILYRKPFAIISSENNRGTRIQSLLDQLGLSDRYYDDFQACDKAQPWNIPIDYDNVHAKLETLRTNSFLFLKESLL